MMTARPTHMFPVAALSIAQGISFNVAAVALIATSQPAMYCLACTIGTGQFDARLVWPRCSLEDPELKIDSSSSSYTTTTVCRPHLALRCSFVPVVLPVRYAANARLLNARPLQPFRTWWSLRYRCRCSTTVGARTVRIPRVASQRDTCEDLVRAAAPLQCSKPRSVV